MKKVILDCDNTMGIYRSDIDDGLTFLYLYGHSDIDLLGITCTFANNNVNAVYYNTMQMLEDLNIIEVPFFRGGRNPGDYDSDAVDYLVKMANKYPKEITVLAIGSMCNIAGAYSKDSDFFNKLDRVIVMGGITEPFYINEVLCEELNFASDYKSAGDVMFNCKKLSILTAQTTFGANYEAAEIDKLLSLDTPLIKYLKPIIERWTEHIGGVYKIRHFTNWDLCTAIYLTNPELFSTENFKIKKDYEAMKKGLLVIQNEKDLSDEEVNTVDIPTKLLDLETFNELFYNELKKIKVY
ncbi:MAG TPA: nucleoside hydrolase [Victivallales bacterium]|nr:nucleoside hydrolase [Victivallales bacterium]